MAGLCLASATAAANPLDVYGAGPEGQAMAGAGTAFDRSGAAAYYNPADLAFADRLRLDIGGGYLGSELTYDGANGGSDPFAAAEVSLVAPFGGKLRGLAFGLYGLFPADDLGRVLTRDPGTPQFLEYQALHRFALFAALAYHLGPVAAGVGIQLLNSAQGTLSLTEDLAAASIPQRTLQLDLLPRVSFNAGLAWNITSFLRLGASYRGPAQIGLGLPADVSFGPLAFDLQLEALSFWRPPTWNVGLAYLSDAFSVDLDGSWLQWSQAPDPALQAQFTPTTPLLPTLASGPSNVQLHDEPVVRLGADVHLGGPFSLLAGYAYAPNPVPDQTGPTNILDCDRHEVAAGLLWTFGDLLGFSTGPDGLLLGGQYHALVGRQALKTDPLDPYGDASYGGSLWMVNLTLTLRFGGEGKAAPAPVPRPGAPGELAPAPLVPEDGS